MKSSREQFEERFPTPTGVHWDESNQCYVCKFVSPYLALWMGWQASREAIEIELPFLYPAYRQEVVAVLEAIGLKVKPYGN